MKFNMYKKKLVRGLKRIFTRSTGNLIKYEQLKQMQKDGAILVDVRSIQEYNEYHLNGSINIPVYELSTRIDKVVKDTDDIIILYCQSGARSEKASQILNNLGYINIFQLQGGLDNIKY